MNNVLKTAAALGFAGAMALASATPSMAREWRHNGWNNGAAAAGGFVAGAALGAAATAGSGGYYGDDYAYNGGYGGGNSYGYQPGYDSYGAAGYNSYGSAGSAYGSGFEQPEGIGPVEGRSSFDTNNIGPNRERNIRATW